MAMRPAAVNDPEGVAFEHPAPDQDDPNEAYDVVPMKSVAHGPPGDWWTVTRNGIPDRHFSAGRKAENDTPPTPRTGPPSAARKRRTIEAGPDEIHC